jgi:TonB family protein
LCYLGLAMQDAVKVDRAPRAALIASLLLHGIALGVAVMPRPAEAVRATAEPIAIDASIVELPLPSPPAADPEMPAAIATAKVLPAPARARLPQTTPAAAARAETAGAPPVEPASVDAPHFVLASSISFASTARADVGIAGGPGAAALPNSAPVQPLNESQVTAKARLVSSSPAVYPAEARDAEVEGDVVVELVVDTAGHVVDARSVTQLGYGLEVAAKNAVRAYRFQPALKDRTPVAVRMRWTVEFRLR